MGSIIMLKIQTEEIIDSVKYRFLLYTGTKTLIWVQDAGSSNLPTRTKSQNLHCRFWLFLCLWCSLFFAACVSRLPVAPQSSMFCYISQAYIRAKNRCSVIHSFKLKMQTPIIGVCIFVRMENLTLQFFFSLQPEA